MTDETAGDGLQNIAGKGNQAMYAVGDVVYFWTGRGSHGYATIREIRGDRFLLDPEPDATKGSDYRNIREPNPHTRWAPRDRGVLAVQIDTPPRFWYTNF